MDQDRLFAFDDEEDGVDAFHKRARGYIPFFVLFHSAFGYVAGWAFHPIPQCEIYLGFVSKSLLEQVFSIEITSLSMAQKTLSKFFSKFSPWVWYTDKVILSLSESFHQRISKAIKEMVLLDETKKKNLEKMCIQIAEKKENLFLSFSQIQQMGIPVFIEDWKNGYYLLQWSSEEAMARFSLLLGEKFFTADVEITLKKKTYALSRRDLMGFVGEQGVWAICDHTLLRVGNTEIFENIPLVQRKLSFDDLKDFFLLHYQKHSNTPYFETNIGEVVLIEEEPTEFALRLEGRRDTNHDTPIILRIIPYAVYDNYFLPIPLRGNMPLYELYSPRRKKGENKKTLVIIKRQIQKEKDFRKKLRQLSSVREAEEEKNQKNRMSPGALMRRDFLSLFRKENIERFIEQDIPLLLQAGVSLYGDADLLTKRKYTPSLSLSIFKNNSLFSFEGKVRFGDYAVELEKFYELLKKNEEEYIPLSPTERLHVSPVLRRKLLRFFGLCEEKNGRFSLHVSQAGLVEDIFSLSKDVSTAPEVSEFLHRLKSFEKIVSQPLPVAFQGHLRPYQEAGYHWLWFLYEYGFGGILADDMGLGKTVQTLVFLLSLKEKGLLQKPALIVVPRSLLFNWLREAELFTPSLRLHVFSEVNRKKEKELFDSYDAILTTYGIVQRDKDFLKDYPFMYIILDEAQAIKNPLSQRAKAIRSLSASHRLCLTGTPIENTPLELWSLFHFLMPGFLGGIEYFKRHFVLPLASDGPEADEAKTTLIRMVYPFILRRTKEQVAKDLPPRVEEVLYLEMKSSQRDFYEKVRELYRQRLEGLWDMEERDARMLFLEGLLRLRQASIHPLLIDKSYTGSSVKIEGLLETLSLLKEENHKVLVFSQFVEVLQIVRSELDKIGIGYAYLDGSTKKREEEVDRFQKDPTISVFLISLKAGGVGLNLTAADYVIILDPWWNPAVERQAMDRAHRIGQKKTVFVYKYVVKDSVEEKILSLQQQKRLLAESIIAADESFFKSLSKEDMLRLFEKV
ncbi:Putative helicase [Brevinematales bacterium NS]|nr:DEAD/DEAH box helicase [Brevinematales bacterium]QJR21726.1 Putative helicase [Brevinematales bacterium NS]